MRLLAAGRGGGAEFAVNFRVCSGNICIWIVYLKMTPVAISRILRIQTRPQGSCMQCNFHAIYKQIVMRPVLDIVERLVVHYLPNDLFNAASHSIEDPVVPALIWQPPLGTIAFGTRGEWAMNNCAQLSFGVFGEHVRAAVIGRIPPRSTRLFQTSAGLAHMTARKLLNRASPQCVGMKRRQFRL